MKHHNSTRKFGRVSKQRTALLRSLAISLIENGKIKTTEAKAKELRPFVEKLVTKAGEGSLSARRLLLSRLGSGGDVATKMLVEDIAPKYKEREGGYTRIVKIAPTSGDSVTSAIIEFV